MIMPLGGKIEVNQGGGGMYAADVVFCIDATGSMTDAIDEVKAMASGFSARVKAALLDSGRAIETLRVKVITFRDFGVDTDALVSSPFYTLSDEDDAFQAYVNGIVPQGGGDEPENALEALAEAMNSEWTDEGKKRRHIIVLFTDASAIRLEDSDKSHPQYPANVPANLMGLQDWWEGGTPNGCLQESAERLILFAPEAEPWSTIRTWNKVEGGVPVEPGRGCAEATMEKILALIAKSVSTTFTQ